MTNQSETPSIEAIFKPNVPGQGEVLFAKIPPEQVAAWEARFGGAEA